ncbi:sulfite exporter TauE/SafE family protein [uncultured Azonexus sp.]|uniref:sulfite exporter TauE/SafE family protein n=1 Tax=uncultured Azonexus sp. TaxID=520307 RepID=UPI00261EC364|nr:sulfite exporter TauE/SafE family protein [uncultured Azonexus sp.]
MPDSPVDLFSVWLLGLALGLTACTVTCLPFMATWTLGRGGKLRDNLVDTLLFLSGRLTAYSALGAIAGASGGWLLATLASGIGNFVIGVASLGAAVWLAVARDASGTGGCALRRRGAGASPFLLGVSLTLIPCLPLATLLASCAAAGSGLQGGVHGAVFGLGALISPMLVLIPACGGLGRMLREQVGWIVPWLRYCAAAVLLLLGARRLLLVDLSVALGMSLIALLWLLLLEHRRTMRAARVIVLRQLA